MRTAALPPSQLAFISVDSGPTNHKFQVKDPLWPRPWVSMPLIPYQKQFEQWHVTCDQCDLRVALGQPANFAKRLCKVTVSCRRPPPRQDQHHQVTGQEESVPACSEYRVDNTVMARWKDKWVRVKKHMYEEERRMSMRCSHTAGTRTLSDRQRHSWLFTIHSVLNLLDNTAIIRLMIILAGRICTVVRAADSCVIFQMSHAPLHIAHQLREI